MDNPIRVNDGKLLKLALIGAATFAVVWFLVEAKRQADARQAVEKYRIATGSTTAKGDAADRLGIERK